MSFEFSIFALHGFLGQPKDWDSFSTNFSMCAIDLFDPEYVKLDLEQCAEGINAWAEKTPSREGKVIMGYSLGGRLALHVLLGKPAFWSGGVIISSHLGLKTEKEKQERYQRDLHWADRFSHDPWEKVIQDWNAQGVFSRGKDFFQRREEEFDRATLAQAFKNWSLGKQEDLSERIQTVDVPILWVVGEYDEAYRQQGSSLPFRHPLSKIVVIPQAGHRVPWDNPCLFKESIREFLIELKALNK